MKDKAEEEMEEQIPQVKAVSLPCAFLIGAAMSLAWGMLSALLHLDRLFPDTASSVMFSKPLPVQLALYGVASPVVEEFLFRKLLFDLVRKLLPALPAAVAVSALFALWHGNVIQMLYAFWAGMILQALRQKGERMEAPVLCHIGANMTAIVVSAFQT